MKTFLSIPFILLLLIFSSSSLSAQLFDSLDIGNINARFWADGAMFWDKVGNSKFEYPKGSGKHCNFASGLWLGGGDAAGQLRVAAQTYQQNGTDFWAGPIVSFGGSYQDSLYNARYNRVWKISKAEIDNHITNYAQAGYITPQIILDWPGNGNVLNGEAAQLAPYFDANNDQIYNPQLGDYPLIKGDQALFMLFNDSRAAHGETNTSPLGLEIKALAYAFNTPSDTVINNTIFLSYSITNRSQLYLTDCYMGVWDDFDLGYYNDDKIGCDSTLQAFYAYNADNNDASYGINPPATGLSFLNEPLSKLMYYTNAAGAIGHPTAASHYYNYLRGLWKNGTLLVNNGQDGYAPTAPGASTDFAFTGYPELSQGWLDNANNVEQYCLGTHSIGDFIPNQTICLDIAYNTARGSDNLNSIAVLRQAIQHTQYFYRNNKLTCAAKTNVAINKPLNDNTMGIFPNPISDNRLNLSTQIADHYDLSIWNTNAQIVHHQNELYLSSQATSVHLPTLPNGMYLLQLKDSKGQTISHKIIVE